MHQDASFCVFSKKIRALQDNLHNTNMKISPSKKYEKWQLLPNPATWHIPEMSQLLRCSGSSGHFGTEQGSLPHSPLHLLKSC
jgi:hypothetical protein